VGNIRLGTGSGIADLQRRARAKAVQPAVVASSKPTSLHQQLIAQIVAKHGLERYGFWKTLRDMLNAYEGGGDIETADDYLAGQAA
jgi:hypothetical protein